MSAIREAFTRLCPTSVRWKTSEKNSIKSWGGHECGNRVCFVSFFLTYCPTPDGWVSTRAYATSSLLLRVFLLFSFPHLFSVSFAWRGGREDRGPTFLLLLLLFGSFGGGGGVFSRDSLTDARAAAAAGDGERAEIEIRQHTRCTNYARISKLCSGVIFVLTPCSQNGG